VSRARIALGAGPKVSVVIPTFKHRDFICRTLESVFNQTMTDYEVIVVNDGSPDDTAAVLAPLIETKRIQYFEQANLGQSNARNHGIQVSRGYFIALLDDDDVWPNDKLEWQTQFLEEHPDVGMVGGTLRAIDEHGSFKWEGVFTPSIDFETLFSGNPFLSPGQTLIRADLLKRLGGMSAEIWGADDWDLWFRIAKISRIVMLNRLALYYRLHPGNASRQTARLLSACCRTFETHLRDIPSHDRPRLRSAFERTMYNGLGAPIVRSARHQLRRGKLITATRSISALSALWRGILFDPRIRAEFVKNVLGN
jgi:glycosyltransferase involved in cell wall biosynthesis